MSKTTAALVIIIVGLTAVVAFLLGQQNSEDGLHSGLFGDGASETSAPAQEQEEMDAPVQQAAPVRAVRIGTDGPREYACRAVGVVANLPQTGGSNDYLAVRQAPTTRGAQIDKLGMGHPIILCDQNSDGSWLGVVYQNDGLPPADRCGVVTPVATQRPYDGPCQSGWVYARYVELAGR